MPIKSASYFMLLHLDKWMLNESSENQSSYIIVLFVLSKDLYQDWCTSLSLPLFTPSPFPAYCGQHTQ